jgi:predicted lipid-binding transport protein (Tim44 family)
LVVILVVVVVGMILAFTLDAIFAAIIFTGLFVFGAIGGVVAAAIRPRGQSARQEAADR